MTTKKGDFDHEPTDAAIDTMLATGCPLFTMLRGRLVFILPIGTGTTITPAEWLEALDSAIHQLELLEAKVSESGVQA